MAMVIKLDQSSIGGLFLVLSVIGNTNRWAKNWANSWANSWVIRWVNGQTISDRISQY